MQKMLVIRGSAVFTCPRGAFRVRRRMPKAAATRGFVPDPGVDSTPDKRVLAAALACGVYSEDTQKWA
jgi:hypothetical protein